MRTTSWFLLSILLSVSALYFSPTLEWSLRPSLSEIDHKAVVTKTKNTTTPAPAKKPVEVAVQKPSDTEVAAPQRVLVEPEPAHETPGASSASASNDEVPEISQHVFADSNDERTKHNLAALVWDEQIASIARAHSADMLDKNYFSHEDPNGCSSSCRADNADYRWTAIGENIYMTTGYKLSSAAEAEMIVNGWMNSSGHRANILGTKFTHTGVGIAVKGDKVYITAMYSKPR